MNINSRDNRLRHLLTIFQTLCVILTGEENINSKTCKRRVGLKVIFQSINLWKRMSLYDDIDENIQNKAKSVTGWNSGIKLLHSQLQLKKAMVTQVGKFLKNIISFRTSHHVLYIYSPSRKGKLSEGPYQPHFQFLSQTLNLHSIKWNVKQNYLSITLNHFLTQ